MILSTEEHWATNVWMNNLRYAYTYDANGNSVAGKNELWENSTWVPTTDGYFWFDLQKNIQYQIGSIYRFEATFKSFINAIADMDRKNSSISVYPNPACEKITVEILEPVGNSSSSVIIYGIDGRERMRQQIQGTKSEINVGQLPAGMYFIRLNNDNGTRHLKFIKS